MFLYFQANKSFEQQKYTLAITLYNKAISYCPNAAVLYANRAAAYMKRTWYEPSNILFTVLNIKKIGVIKKLNKSKKRRKSLLHKGFNFI